MLQNIKQTYISLEIFLWSRCPNIAENNYFSFRTCFLLQEIYFKIIMKFWTPENKTTHQIWRILRGAFTSKSTEIEDEEEESQATESGKD